jgi:hypothetical protein
MFDMPDIESEAEDGVKFGVEAAEAFVKLLRFASARVGRVIPVLEELSSSSALT